MRFAFLLMRNGWRRSKNEESTSRFFIAKFQLHNNLIAVAGDKQGLWRGVFGVRMDPQKHHPQSSCNRLLRRLGGAQRRHEMRGLVSSERLRGVVVSAKTVSGSEFLTRRMLSVCITAQRTPGEGWNKLMEDLTDLRKVLPEASGTAGFFWNGLSFDCFPIVCSQIGRLKKAAEPAAHK